MDDTTKRATSRLATISSVAIVAPLLLLLASCGNSSLSLPPPSASSLASHQAVTSTTTLTSRTVGSTSAASNLPGTTAGAKWVLTSNVLKVISQYPEVYQRIVSQGVIEITPIHSTPLLGAGILPAVKFTSALTLAKVVSAGELPSWAKAVAYDPEFWQFTPANEQSDPVSASQTASVAARAAGLVYVVTPALDLTKAIAPGTLSNGQSLIAQDLFGKLASTADVLVVQTQSLEDSSTKFSSILSQASQQARSANPRIDLLGGLSTDLHGSSATLTELSSAYKSGLAQANGYWFNVPGPSIQCPACTGPNFPLALSFLSTGTS